MGNSYFKKAEIGAWLSIAAYMVLSAIKLIMSQNREFRSFTSRWIE